MTEVPAVATESAARPPVENIPKSTNIPHKENTRVWQKRAELLQLAQDKDVSTIFLIAGTGTGKTFAGSQIMLEAIGPTGKMVMTENLRKATQASAETIADDRGEEVGKTVGFQNRYHRAVSADTRLLFCPMQSLLNKVERDPLLNEYDLVMVDEVHKESKQNEILLATLKDIQAKRKSGGKPLKIVLTSATMDAAKLGEYFPGAKTVEVPGENIEVPPVWHEKEVPMKELPQAAAEKVKWAIQDQKDTGNILVFLSGKPQIDEAKKALETMKLGDDVEVHPYYGTMTKEEQNLITEKLKGSNKRLVFLATNAAQESLTWPIQVVIDTCTHKQQKFDPITGRSYLMEEKAPLDHLTQRKGRVGRKKPEDPTHPDKYYPLTTQSDWEGRKKYETAEIQRTDLSTEILTLLAGGYDPNPNSTKPNAFKYLNKPDRSHVDSAYKRLEKIGALKDGSLTEKGRFMASLQLSANNASLVADGIRYGVVEDAAALAAMLETYPTAFAESLSKEGDSPTSDLTPLIGLLKGYGKAEDKKAWATERGLRFDDMKDAFDLYKGLLEEGRKNPPPLSADQLVQIGTAGLDLAIHDSFADAEVTGFKKGSLMVEGVGGSASIRIDKNSTLAKNKNIPVFVSTNIRTIMDHGSEKKFAGLNHELSREVQGILYGKETAPTSGSKKPEPKMPEEKKEEQITEPEAKSEKKEKKEETSPPPEPPKKLKWWQKLGNWFKRFFG